MNVAIQVDGIDETLELFAQVPEKMRKKHIRQSLNKAATPILKEIRRLMRIAVPGLDNNAINKRSFTTAGTFSVVIGPNHKDRNFPLVHIFELGTVQRFTGTKTLRRKRETRTVATGGVVRRTGRIKAHRFLARGFAAKSGQADAILQRELSARILREFEAG